MPKKAKKVPKLNQFLEDAGVTPPAQVHLDDEQVCMKNQVIDMGHGKITIRWLWLDSQKEWFVNCCDVAMFANEMALKPGPRKLHKEGE